MEIMNDIHRGTGYTRQPIAEGVIAEEGHNPDFAGETLQDVLGLLGIKAEGLGHAMERLRPMVQERDRVAFFWRVQVGQQWRSAGA